MGNFHELPSALFEDILSVIHHVLLQLAFILFCAARNEWPVHRVTMTFCTYYKTYLLCILSAHFFISTHLSQELFGFILGM